MLTLNGHFDGKTIVLDEPASPALRKGARVKVFVEPEDQPRAMEEPVPGRFRPLNINADPELANAIALDPEFNIEES
jgi:hypothetical protein